MGRSKTIMLDIKRGGYMRRSATVTDTDQWIPGRVGQVGTTGALEVPTTDNYPKGFIVEGKKASDGQTSVAIIMDKVVFAPEAYNNEFTSAGTFASGISASLAHGDDIYFDSTGALTTIAASGVGTKLVGHWDADADVVDGNIDFASTGD
jgi:hypothetical protein